MHSLLCLVLLSFPTNTSASFEKVEARRRPLTAQVRINPFASKVFARHLSQFNRILVLGAGGWFGKTAIAMLEPDYFSEKSLSFIGRTARSEFVNGREVMINTWDGNYLERLRPELVLDFAFLTRDFAKIWGVDRYRKLNGEISARLMEVAKFHSVKCVVTASSGAAVQANGPRNVAAGLDYYGSQKRDNEAELRRISDWRGTTIVTARAWSVTGGFVRQPTNYAFSDFIQSVHTKNAITIHSLHPVYRRFCSVEDFLALSVAETNIAGFTVVESGGPLLEIRKLAKRIAREIGDDRTEIDAPAPDSSEADNYYSDNQSWSRTVGKHSLRALTLPEQIRNVSEALKVRSQNQLNP